MKKINFLFALIVALNSAELYAQNDLQGNIIIIKENLNLSKKSIIKYSWLETTTISIDGVQRLVVQKQCFYDINGALTKVATGDTQQTSIPSGLKGIIAKNKKADIEAYINSATEKIKQYVPPVSEKLQQLYLSGDASVDIIVPGQKVKLNFSNYIDKGDLVSINANIKSKTLSDYSVKTFVSDPTDIVTFDVVFSALPDGTEYPSSVKFDSPSEKLIISIVNSGYTNAIK